MKKWLPLSILAILALLAIRIAFQDFDHTNDTIYYGGDIVTMNDGQPMVEAIHVKDGKIIALGSKADILKGKTAKTELVDLQGKTLLPGMIDAHGHPDITTVFYDMTDISGFTHKTPESVWKTIADKVANSPQDELLFFKGYDPILTQGLKPPSIRFLDSLAPNTPILLVTQTLHFFYANSKAFALVGITKDTPDPSGSSYYGRDSTGALSGLIVEQAAFEPFRLQMQDHLKKNFAHNAQSLMTDNASKGITTTVTMGMMTANKNLLMLYEHLSAGKAKPLNNVFQLLGMLPKRQPNPRHFVYLLDRDEALLPESPDNGDDFFKIAGIKLFYDGSPYSGSMYLSQPYVQSAFTRDDMHLGPSHQGEAIIKPEDYLKLLEKYQSKGWQIATHCQGDQAILEIMDTYSKLDKKASVKPYRHRLEHCLLLPESVMASMKAMNVSPSFHINHILYYGDALQSDILGEERVQKMLPLHTYERQQMPFSLHADQPMYEANPLSLASTAVNRTTESGNVVNDSESVSAWEALKAVTSYAAWQLHLEDKLGSIALGKYADLVILDKNPLKVPKQDISRIQVLETIVAGNSVWRK